MPSISNSFRKDNPCVPGCPDRCAECHSTCEKYKAYRKALDAKKSEARSNDYGKVPNRAFTSPWGTTGSNAYKSRIIQRKKHSETLLRDSRI